MQATFASNQIFQVSGSLESIEEILDMAIRHSGHYDMLTREDDRVSVIYQITDNDLYCIGWGRIKNPTNPAKYSYQFQNMNTVPEGWSEYPFDYDPKIIGKIIAQWIKSQPEPKSVYDGYDGGHSTGFLCECLWGHSFEVRQSIKSPFYGIVTFKPYANWYSK